MRRSIGSDAGTTPSVRPTSPAPSTPPGADIAGYRVLRRIASGHRADVLLAVASRAEPASSDEGPGIGGEPASLVALRVYRDDSDDLSIATEIAVMDGPPHAAPPRLIDVATAADGARVLVVERIAGTTVAQLLTDRPLEPGEAVTLVAPVAAAVAELAARGFVHLRLSPSDVRLDETGRPRLLGLGGVERLPQDGAQRTALRREGLAALVDYVEAVVGAVRPGGVFDEARLLMARALEQRPFVPFERELERALFAAAAPAAISGAASTQVGRMPARLIPPQQVAESGIGHASSLGDARVAARASMSTATARLLDVAEIPVPIVERLADSIDGDRLARFRLGIRRRMAGRRRQLVVAGLVGGAALVVLLTAVPPSSAGAGDDRAGAAVTPTGSSVAPDTVPEGAAPSASTAAPERSMDVGAVVEPTGGGDALSASVGPAAAAAELVRRRSACFAELDLDCLRPIMQPGSPIEESDWNLMLAARDGGPSVLPLDADRVEVVAEMGAAVLVRVPVDGETQPASLLIVRSEAGWRLREVFD